MRLFPPFIIQGEWKGYMCLYCKVVVLVLIMNLERGVIRKSRRSIPDAVVDRGRGVVAPVAHAEPCPVL